ncbi:MAG: DUF2335 domain-containing protein [Gammaproteobacteria bacterium]|nr:DUF2335 domain-containing protein [Gammaproteobacteria bacterium]
MLSEYDTVHDGLANRIVAMAESQQKHRQKLEASAVEAAIKTENSAVGWDEERTPTNRMRLTITRAVDTIT